MTIFCLYTFQIFKKSILAFVTFYKKKLQLYKKISSPHNYKKNYFSFKYKNGKPRAKFIIK